MLHAARWVALALTAHAFALAALAQSPLPDAFNPGAGGAVYSLALQADGKILAGGGFLSLGGQSRNFIARLNADGTPDTGFNPGANNNVFSVALQADGKSLVGGQFTTLAGRSRNYIGRLNADGTLDISFNPGANGGVFSLALQAEGKILVGGGFTTLGGQSRTNIGRLNANGTLDTSFNPGANSFVRSLALQADGKILVGGSFTTLGGQSRNHIGRLNADGALDTSFNPGANSTVYSLAVQADGQILVGGGFLSLGGQSRNFIGRLNADGTLDTSFNPGASGGVDCVALQADGKILVGGGFTTLAGQSRTNIGRLNNTGPATQSLTFDGSALTWTREGTSPEVWRTTFEYSPDGSAWTNLGGGIRISGGWQLTGLALPTNTAVRARGYTAGGYENSSSWFVETIIGSPAVYTQPASRTNNAGTTAAFTVYAVGSGLLSYQWRKDGANLADGGNVSGAATASLTLSDVLGGDAGGYSVVISNAYGSLTSAVATLKVMDPVIYAQPASQARNAGDSATFGVVAAGTAPLSYQWRKDGVTEAGATQSSLTLTNLQESDAGSYDVVISSVWGSATSTTALLSVNLALPDSFNPGADGVVLSMAVQADGKFLVAGRFTTLGGQRGDGIGRLNANGTPDTSFNPWANDWVNSLVVQADGRILVGGSFTTLGGQRRFGIGRLNADGTLDTSFNPGMEAYVYSLVVQADGKILVGGFFFTLGGQSLTNIVGRFNADGTLDTSFKPGADNDVYSLAVQADGKILVGGNFSTLGGQSRNFIGRLNADGTLDTTFNPGADTWVDSLAVQADGKILVGGQFTTLGGQSRSHLGRLNANGTLDTSFNPGAGGVTYPNVYSLAVQADGKILVGGLFTTLDGQSRHYIGRLNANGTLDTSFNPGADDVVESLALQADGNILVGGAFTTLGGQSRTNLGRLNNTGLATQSLTFDGSTLTWMRGGASPEVWRTTFEYSPDGASLTNLGGGIRIPGGWQLTGLVLPPNTTFRARGYTVGGADNATGWFVETIIGSPGIESQPASLTNNAGTTAAFTVDAVGGGPLSYQWRKDGANLADGGNVSGAATASLTLSNVFGGDAGAFSVVITNAYGSVTSVVATLTVIDPVINTQPASQTGNPGDNVTFSVAAVGTAPLSYQWRKDGALLAGATQSSLTLTNFQGSDAGSYDVVVSSAWGSVTSAASSLTVNLASPDSFNPGADGDVYALAVQADGKILVGGYFFTLGGQSRNNIGRLNADGTLDTSFNPGANYFVNSLAVQADGKILVGGVFSALGGQSRTNIGRLNGDGTPDTSFNPGANDSVRSLVLQADGKILVGGFFTTLGGQSRNNIGRLNADGRLDVTFNPGANSFVESLALQADGKILVGGDFTTLGGQYRNSIGRLNVDGTLDTTFNPRTDAIVDSLAVQADGKILVGGFFGTLGGQSRRYVGRLNADGTLDTSFNPESDYVVGSLAVQADGKILVGGEFSTLGGQSRHYMGRLNADGTLDTSFNPGANGYVFSLAVQADGKILAGGGFTTLGGQSRNRIGQLDNSASATQSLTFDGSTLTWMRGGASPEVWRTTFEYSPDSSALTNLGGGIRIPGGWQLTGLALPMNTTFRARGYTVGGFLNASGWFVETSIGWPGVDSQPASLTNNFGTTAAFTVYAVGSGPLSYQWRKDGGTLADGGNVSGASTASLTLSNVFGGDAGGYSVVISNPAGSVTSALATLTVIDPVINAQPASQTRNAGDSVTLSVAAAGTPPLSYQWRKDGVAQAGATQSSRMLTNFQGSEAGGYDVVVSDPWGSVTSAVALLSVNLALPDSFNPDANGVVYSLAVQADGKILVGGYVFTLGGQGRDHIGRLNADGTLDTTFDPGASTVVDSLVVQADGKILVGGSFIRLGGQRRSNIGRLNADGTLDTSFDPGADYYVDSLAVQADGKILVGGDFIMLGGQYRFYIGRLNADGTLDTSFNPEASFLVRSLAGQADGKILVGGDFTTLGGQYRDYIGRLNADGTLDLSFNPGAGNAVRDTSFNPGADGQLYSLALQADGKILVGGEFTTLGGQSRNSIGRLNDDGTLDTSFNPGAGGTYPDVTSLAVQADGKILVGGYFTTLGGHSRNNIGRLNNTGPATQSLTFDGSTLTWTRGGTSPEVWRTTFEYSADGASWTNLGGGIRIPGGWQLGGLALPTSPTFRARGYTVGGQYNGSSWFVETVLRQPLAISDIRYSANGQFRFRAGGPAGQMVVIEASPDLRNWTPLQTNTLGAAPLSFSDLQTALLPVRFYRLRSGP